MQKLDQQTLNFTDEHIANIAAMFPHCVTEVEDENGRLKKAIDFDLLKQELSANIVEGPKERYRIDWPGKRASLVSANTPITKTLRPAVDESVNFDTTENLYIEGDNLEALKLLQESYLGAIKMIYIDPPYNTGKDFVYKDNFTRSKEEELEASGQVDEEGGRLVANLESNGRFHSDWLSMMYPRLRLARNLLKDDGVIFISIDDNEVHNLRKICDEIFGEDNYIQEIIWEKKFSPQNDAKYFSLNHEQILCYAKNKINFQRNLLPITEEQLSRYTNIDNDPRGVWQSGDLTVARMTPKDRYEVITPNGTKIMPTEGRSWGVSQEKFLELHNDNRIWYGKDGGNTPRLKRFLKETQQGRVPISIFKYQEVGHTQEASQSLKALFGGKKYFDYPKPLKLIQTLVYLGTNKDDIVLDFFSGSATTAHAVMQLNSEDHGNRKFIMVQLKEELTEKSDAYKDGYKTITEIAKKRIVLAAEKIRDENSNKEGIEDLDIGFRVLKIDESNMKDIYFTPDTVDRASLFDTVDHIKEDRTPEDLLFGVLVDWGVDLTLPIRRETIHGKTVFFVGHDDLTACFDEDLDIDFIKELAGRDAMRVVFKESGFKDDETKINAEQIFTQLSPGTDLRVI